MTKQNSTSYSFLIVGSGRVARHIQNYFNLLNTPYDHWDRSQDPIAIQNKVLKATHVYLAISDSALEGFYRQKLEGLEKTVVHFSGTLHIKDCISAHPLMTFGPEMYDLEFYKQIFFTLCGNKSFSEAFPMLSNAHTTITPEQKPFYHALCVMGGNFTAALTKKMTQEMRDFGIPAQACKLFIERSVENAIEHPQLGLTGPIVRKDSSLVEQHLQALQNDNYKSIYEAFLKTLWPEYPKR